MADFDRDEFQATARGGAAGWALRRFVFWGVVGLLLYAGVSYRATWMPHSGDAPAVAAPPAAVPSAAAQHSSASVPNSLVYRADKFGHVWLDAAVDGASVRFVVDTGATLVALTLRDAEAVGIRNDDLTYDQAVNTANGVVRVARVTLRELRVGQFSAYDVPATVNRNLGELLLGMSFLNRLESYEMRDGVLTMNW